MSTSPQPDTMRRIRRVRSTTVGLCMALAVGAMATLAPAAPASAGIVPTVDLHTAANYSVIANSTVTNTGSSVLDGSVGLSPGTSVTGFPPGIVTPPAIIDAASSSSLQAQIDLTTAYNDAAGRSVEFTEPNPDLAGRTLVPGVYAAAAKAPLGLTGRLVLDGQGNPNAVFIFQTDSTLTTSTGSTVEVINGASECNVFWQVGSSATLRTGSTFVGNILAQISITVENSVTVRGRALARTGAVTLDQDRFFAPSCLPSADVTSTTAAGGAATTTVGGGPTTSLAPSVTVPPVTGGPLITTDLTLPETGGDHGLASLTGMVSILAGGLALAATRRRRTS